MPKDCGGDMAVGFLEMQEAYPMAEAKVMHAEVAKVRITMMMVVSRVCV